MFEKLLEPQEFRWPQPGDQLLRKATRWESGVRFADHPIARDSHIWDGYVRGASVLVDHCKQHDIDRHDLAYVIIFNYRHGLEVAIKWVLDRYGRYVDIRDRGQNHDLATLWRMCKRVITELGGPGDDAALGAVEKIVLEFHALDPTSFAFRYSKSKKGETVELPDIVVDLVNLQDVMEGVNNFFVGVDGQLDSVSSAAEF